MKKPDEYHCLFIGGCKDGDLEKFDTYRIDHYCHAFPHGVEFRPFASYLGYGMQPESSYQTITLAGADFWEKKNHIAFIILLEVNIEQCLMGQYLVKGYADGKKAIKALAGDV